MSFHLPDLLPFNHHTQNILHALFESMACAVGYRIYKSKRQQVGDAISSSSRKIIVLGAAIGSVVGSRIPGLLESHRALDPALCLTKKTIVGGLLGAWFAVECTKLLLKEKKSSGDLFTEPLIIAMMVGRIGCFLSGAVDATYGVATDLFWAVDFGDGVSRHPTQLYEFFWLLGLLLVARQSFWTSLRPGSKFRSFLFSYLLFRLVIDSWKPLYLFTALHLSLSATQWSALFGICILVGLGAWHNVRSRLHILRYEYKHLFSVFKEGGSKSHIRE
ncbi:MAG: prolipoprotein diacylglyceryl transferase [Proteobacteria bacterium]|nr:prolipoprotein diacylglyceryl transferase [Pseudomonadota bacterium]